ncbi:hypothetical protein HanIR_Chr11g0530621 [Helianthus annuus]|nr:hypothetical protein HanIR_Chr11g0530621 [Helianthus annuus]
MNKSNLISIQQLPPDSRLNPLSRTKLAIESNLIINLKNNYILIQKTHGQLSL